MKYRKKPVEVEAYKFTGHGKNVDFILRWSEGNTSYYIDPIDGNYLEVETLEGIMSASVGDYIIKGVKGEFYPCKPDIFELTYEQLPWEEQFKETK